MILLLKMHYYYFIPLFYEEIEVWSSELIVRILHILAKCGQENGASKLLEYAPELFKYYKEIIDVNTHLDPIIINVFEYYKDKEV